MAMTARTPAVQQASHRLLATAAIAPVATGHDNITWPYAGGEFRVQILQRMARQFAGIVADRIGVLAGEK